MKILHVTSHPLDAKRAFDKAAEFSTGVAHHKFLKITWPDGSCLRFASIQDISDAHLLMGFAFAQIIFDTDISEKVRIYLLSLVRERLS